MALRISCRARSSSGSMLNTTARDIFARFDFSEIRLPILEKTELFARSIGETTDIVEKEMYTFVDKKITMRPEATASLLRAYIEHGLLCAETGAAALSPSVPMFRHERPQKGRLRQFHQMDVEVLGSAEPAGRCRTDGHGRHAAGGTGPVGQPRDQFPGLPGLPARRSGPNCWPFSPSGSSSL